MLQMIQFDREMILLKAFKGRLKSVFCEEAQTPSPCFLSAAISENTLPCRDVKCKGMKCDTSSKEAVESDEVLTANRDHRGNPLGIRGANPTNGAARRS